MWGMAWKLCDFTKKLKRRNHFIQHGRRRTGAILTDREIVILVVGPRNGGWELGLVEVGFWSAFLIRTITIFTASTARIHRPQIESRVFDERGIQNGREAKLVGVGRLQSELH